MTDKSIHKLFRILSKYRKLINFKGVWKNLIKVFTNNPRVIVSTMIPHLYVSVDSESDVGVMEV